MAFQSPMSILNFALLNLLSLLLMVARVRLWPGVQRLSASRIIVFLTACQRVRMLKVGACGCRRDCHHFQERSREVMVTGAATRSRELTPFITGKHSPCKPYASQVSTRRTAVQITVLPLFYKVNKKGTICTYIMSLAKHE